MHILIVFLLCLRSTLAGESRPRVQEVPTANPHPPVTAADQRRVAFAETAAGLLTRSFKKSKAPTESDSFSQMNVDFSLEVSEECLKSRACLEKSAPLKRYLNWYRLGHLPFKSLKFAHIIPWSWENYQKSKASTEPSGKSALTTDGAPFERAAPAHGMHSGVAASRPKTSMSVPRQRPDEFMVHLYALEASGVWQHVDVFLAEDPKGGLTLRRFFVIPVQSRGAGDLPPGVEC